jgi:hypothetical protein
MPPSRHATSHRHLSLFRRTVEQALIDLGVNDWQVYVEHAKLAPNVRADCLPRLTKRSATIRLATTFDGPVSESDLMDCARHEALHVALAAVCGLGGSRFVTEDELEAAEEYTVQRFLRCVRWQRP